MALVASAIDFQQAPHLGRRDVPRRRASRTCHDHRQSDRAKFAACRAACGDVVIRAP
jgi:hypothetical protein